jgi:hypothetical protein
MRDADRDRLQQLLDWRSEHGVISACFDVDPADRGEGWRILVKDGLGALEEPDEHDSKVAVRETTARLLERYAPGSPPPGGRAQFDFAEVTRKDGSEDRWSSQLSLGDAEWSLAPRPILRPLIDLRIRGTAHAVLAVSAERVRGWVWSDGLFEAEAGWEEELETALEGRPKGRDEYARHLEELRKRFLRGVGESLRHDPRIEGTELIAIGEAPHLSELVDVLDPGVVVRRVEGTDVIEESDAQIAGRAGAVVGQVLDDREADLSRRAIDGALASQGRGSIGVDETSIALAEARVDHLLVDYQRSVSLEELNPLARETIREAERPQDGAEVMIELALRSSAEITTARGRGAELLREHGGAAALLRY